jgi:LPS export ABC transporter protein LptC
VSYRLFIALGLTLIAVAMWLALSPRTTVPGTAQTSVATEPELGYAATEARVVETGVDGLPAYALEARQVQQESDSNIIDLASVRMTFRDDRGGEWQMRAAHATARQDSAQIELFGAIDVRGIIGGKPLILQTDTLHVDTREETINTHAPVTINWVGQLTSRGFAANLKSQHLKLESQVHGHFVR